MQGFGKGIKETQLDCECLENRKTKAGLEIFRTSSILVPSAVKHIVGY